MRHRTLVVLTALTVLTASSASAGASCGAPSARCQYEAPPFTLTLVDAATSQPLADVHALAEWQMEGAGGRLNGPLMTLDAVSGPDGVINFGGWGPIDGPASGLGIGRDPVLTLFKSGYAPLILNNGDPPGLSETERVRPFRQSGRRYAMEPFLGTPEAWLKQLQRVWLGIAGQRGGDSLLRFREPYLTRLRRIASERKLFPAPPRYEGSFFWHVDREIKFLEDGHR